MSRRFDALLVVGLLLRSTVFRTEAKSPPENPLLFKVQGGSMNETLRQGQVVRVDTTAYRRVAPQRGDIVLLRFPPRVGPPRLRTIKRIVGLPGDVVDVHDGALYVNGQALPEPYVSNSAPYTLNPVEVPQGSYFVLGDRRTGSSDSHLWGPVPGDHIIGKVELPPAD